MSKRYVLKDVTQRFMHDLIFGCYTNIVSMDGKVDYNGLNDHAFWQCAKVLCGATRQWGLLFAGTLGNGKTTLMKAIQRAFVYLGAAEIIPFGEGLRLLSAKDIYVSYDISLWRQKLFEEPLLGIDDLGVEPMEKNLYGTICTPIADLLEYRYNNHLVTILSTNLGRQERLKKYGARIADRFDEMYVAIPFTHNSYRQHENNN